ncbi:MAG: rRNA maturation RNase YbeY [Candidatus Kerfeldbacteria bacterium RIFOXYA2_FULL_38_24]|uniref:Endoribonuclease YbeY n=1 Tax=Candidatus Kerfeldbacteria bacterium RIFOXYB2_FULL_38_14 TaxID=1798547 RepID=A0A1G2BIY3_9BACT|nr:MAG: rRNA maturation RNase YbeY [Candidatus Kerfeldbacteria bacterium RIFOXYA2_FULL_38_24]OGY88260.1 MAG: rRNA maturation RNase YbeY [Candidatus Kerfeldbacteria bacterium RIFOXYB2_FULL_38_14]OGY89383.1 MAG: rRNA maturation RNase YbeY [Candidatus Kerfeldbacteria bacterium RIFOXYC2_FULL_38_9]
MQAELRLTVPFRALSKVFVNQIFQATAKVVHIPQDFVFSVAVVSSPIMKNINRQYRQKAQATDVLSFKYQHHAGEIILSADFIRQQAKAHHHAVRTEAAFLLIHGILHIMGYDHERSYQAAQNMQKKEIKILQLCGLTLEF